MARQVSLFRMLARGVTLRCPRCGGSDLFASWFKLRRECPTCQLLLQRGEHDHWIGGFAVNFAAAELLGVALVLFLVLVTWPEVPWRVIQIGAPIAMVALPLLFFPVSRTLWLAVDLYFRPEHLRR